MDRDYKYFDQYYNELIQDVYHQPIDTGHLKLMEKFIENFVCSVNPYSVLDVGSGDGYTRKILDEKGIHCEEVDIEQGIDFNFLGDMSFDLVLSRHTLEHSPFPLITLMEWHWVSNKWLCIVLPNPEHYTYVGRNHYSVMTSHHAGWLLRRAGWKTVKFHMDKEEIWFLCEKYPRISYEGWAKAPLSQKIHDTERDMYADYGDIDEFF